MKSATSLSVGFRPVRALFVETRNSSQTLWACRLCPFSYYENVTIGWPISVSGLFTLVRHLKGHQGQA